MNTDCILAGGTGNRFEAHAYEAVLGLLAKLGNLNRSGTLEWENRIDGDVAELFSKWEIYEFDVNQDAYTGLVLECRSEKFGDVVIKMYPPFLSRRYIKESFILSTLKEYHQATLLALDKDRNAMLLERVIPGDYIDYDNDQTEIARMFTDMNENKVSAGSVQAIPPEIKSIIEQTEDEFVVASQYDYHPGQLDFLLKSAKTIYRDYFVEEDRFILHGDAYYKNALRSRNGIRVIDPVGYVDAFIFEYMPLLTYELAMHTEPENYLDKYNDMIAFFSGFTDTRKFDAAAFIFLVKQLVPSVYEANDGYKRANIYMQLIKVLFLNDEDELILDKVKDNRVEKS